MASLQQKLHASTMSHAREQCLSNSWSSTNLYINFRLVWLKVSEVALYFCLTCIELKLEREQKLWAERVSCAAALNSKRLKLSKISLKHFVLETWLKLQKFATEHVPSCCIHVKLQLRGIRNKHSNDRAVQRQAWATWHCDYDWLKRNSLSMAANWLKAAYKWTCKCKYGHNTFFLLLTAQKEDRIQRCLRLQLQCCMPHMPSSKASNENVNANCQLYLAKL